MIRQSIALMLAGIAAAPSFAQAPAAAPTPTPSALARKFGAREAVEQISLSPDGTSYAEIAAGPGRRDVLIVGRIDASVKPKAILATTGQPDRLRHCNWANDTRLVCSFYTVVGKGVEGIGYSRMVVINADGTGMQKLSVEPGDNALDIVQYGGAVIDWYGDATGRSVLATRQFVPSVTTGSHVADVTKGLGVERIDMTTLKRLTIEQPRAAAVEYISDGAGNIRIFGSRREDGNGNYLPGVRYAFRAADGGKWQPLSEVKDGGGFDPHAVDPVLNVAYGFDTLDGRQALYKITLDATLKRELLFARSDVDVDALVRIGRKRRVVGVSWVTDRRQIAFFDPELKKMQAALGRALPELPLVYFVDSSADESKLLVRMGSDTDPGRYYVFDKQSRHLDPLVESRPELGDVKLAKVQSVSVTAADGTAIPAYLTLPPEGAGKPVGAIVMPHGGPGARDEWGFDWLAQFFAARGFAVLQPNFRGSTGYGDQWFADNGFRSWRLAIGDVNDAGRWLINQGYATPDKLAIVGWSYGGYAALQSQILDADLFKAIVAIAPVTDLATLKLESVGFKNYALVKRQIGDGPHITEGSPARNVAAFKAPVLMFHGDRDQNVGVGESRLMTDKLKEVGKPVEFVEFKGLDHQLDDSDARAQMLDQADRFLRTHLKIAAP